jgi:hypothetical protein
VRLGFCAFFSTCFLLSFEPGAWRLWRKFEALSWKLGSLSFMRELSVFELELELSVA